MRDSELYYRSCESQIEISTDGKDPHSHQEVDQFQFSFTPQSDHFSVKL